MTPASRLFTQQLGIRYPLICGAMYPCSNPELVASVSEAGGIGIVQPLSLVYVYKYDFREGLRFIRTKTSKPIGMNVITEQSSQIYLDRMRRWVDIALEEGVRFFVSALGNPRWIVDRVKTSGAVVYHDVTEMKWAEKALEAGVDGFICVNNRAGGHAGYLSPDELIRTISPLGKPLVCAGGVGNEGQFAAMINMGYAAVQMGTRFIASAECAAHDDYKQAILKASSDDIVLTERITGVPVSVIRTPAVERMGTEAGPFARWFLKNQRLKHWARLWYTLRSIWQLKEASTKGLSYKDYWQAGKSVDGIERIESAAEIVRRFGESVS